MRSRQLLLCLVLAACAAPQPDYGCACMVLPPSNGILAVNVDGRNYTEGSADAAVPFIAYGVLRPRWESGEPVSRHEIGVGGTFGPIDFNALFPTDEVGQELDPAGIARLTEGRFYPEPGPDAPERTYELGPRGGTVRITDVAPGEAMALRVRGEMQGQFCDVAEGGPCVSIVVRFAFDTDALPITFEAPPVIAG